MQTEICNPLERNTISCFAYHFIKHHRTFPIPNPLFSKKCKQKKHILRPCCYKHIQICWSSLSSFRTKGHVLQNQTGENCQTWLFSGCRIETKGTFDLFEFVLVQSTNQEITCNQRLFHIYISWVIYHSHA